MPAPAPTQDDADAAEYIINEMTKVGARLKVLDEERTALLARRRELYVIGRSMEPRVSGSAMAKAAQVTDAALVLSARRRTS